MFVHLFFERAGNLSSMCVYHVISVEMESCIRRMTICFACDDWCSVVFYYSWAFC